MSPTIRTAIIGLSANAVTSWAAEGHLPYLLSARGKQKYPIVALCNSSVAAAEKAIKHFELPAGTRAYGDPEELAQDECVDLVIVNTRVDVHFPTALPSLKAGKAVWVEWPLAENLTRATEMLRLAQQSGSRTVVGVQGRFAPVVSKLREIVASGVIGKVVSSDVRALRAVFSSEGLPETLEYFTDISIGGNLITVVLGNALDFIHAALGEYSTFSAHAQIQKPRVNLLKATRYVDPDKSVARTVASDVPDLVTIHGTLEPSQHVAAGATLSINFRTEPAPFPGEPAFVWTVYGETGDIKITSPAGIFLHTDSYGEPISIETFDHASGKVSRHDWQWPEWQSGIPPRARNTAELYERFAHESGEEVSYASFEGAVKRHKEIEEILKPFLH